MKILGLLILTVSMAHAGEVSKAEFLKLIKANQSTLSQLTAGMSATDTIISTTTFEYCNEGSCTQTQCVTKYTEEKTVISVYSPRYYVHVKTLAESLTPGDICEISEEDKIETKLNLKFNDINEISLENLTNIEKIQQLGNTKVFELIMSFTDPEGFIHTAKSTVDLSKSFFYSPLVITQSYGEESTISTMTIDGYKSPSSFDLSEIILCTDYPLNNGSYSESCGRSNDYTDIITIQ